MLENQHLILSKNAYFYKKKENVDFSEQSISQIFEDVSEDKIDDFLLQELKVIFEDFSYSLCVFKFEKAPDFIADDCEEDIKELKFAYLVIVEYEQFIIVSKRNISGLSVIYEYCEEVDYYTISRLYVGNDTLFEKFQLQNMNISDRAMRRKTIEAMNLKDNFSALGANKYILSNMRVEHFGSRFSLSFNTSRVNQLGNKYILPDFFDWIKVVANKIIGFAETETYLDIFATPVDYAANINNSNPICLLINFGKIIEDFENGLIKRFYYSYDERKKEIPLIDILLKYNKVFEIENTLLRGQVRYKIKNTSDKTLWLRKNEKSITIQGKKIKNIIIEKSQTSEVDLLEYINRSNNFFVNFEDIELVYYSRTLFRDNKLLAHTDSFLSVFKAQESIGNSIGEKGRFFVGQTNFEENSLFQIIETNFTTDCQYLFCDDLGNEWADFVAVSDDRIAFYHAKSSNEGLSATNFQDVVGQALKNLGNISPAENEWGAKTGKWNESYRNDNVQTNIIRKRKGDNVISGIDYYKKVLLLPNTKKQVHLVVDFISKSNFEANLALLKETGNCQNKNQVVQILWFLSSLVASCLELGVEVYINCKE
jgi:hypothetical protein